MMVFQKMELQENVSCLYVSNWLVYILILDR